MLASEGRAKEAREAYLEAIRRDKNNPFALNNLAYMMARSGEDLQTALHYAQEAKRNRPKSPEINDTLAYVYVVLGMSRNAAAVFEESLDLQPPAQRDKTKRLLASLQRGEMDSVKKEMER